MFEYKKRIETICQSILKDVNIIQDFIKQNPNPDMLIKNPMDIYRLYALTHALQNISEGIIQLDNKTGKQFRESYPELKWASIRGMKNHIVHGYNDINYDMVISTCYKDLTPLKTSISNIINDIRNNKINDILEKCKQIEEIEKERNYIVEKAAEKAKEEFDEQLQVKNEILEHNRDKNIRIENKENLTTNRIITGYIFHTSIDNKKMTYVYDIETKDICYCPRHVKKGSLADGIPWKTIDGKPAGYTPTRVMSLENKKKLGIP